MNFTLATNGMVKLLSTRSFTDSDTASSRLRSSCTMLDFFKHQLNVDSRVRKHIGLHTYLHTYTTLLLYMLIQCSGSNNYIIIIFYCHLMCMSASVYI